MHNSACQKSSFGKHLISIALDSYLLAYRIYPDIAIQQYNSMANLYQMLSLRYPLADRTVPLKRSYRGIVFRKMRKVSRWVNPGAHAGAGQPASSWVTAPSHCPQIPCWAPCWAIIVKMRYSSCQQRLSTDFRNVDTIIALQLCKERPLLISVQLQLITHFKVTLMRQIDETLE